MLGIKAFLKALRIFPKASTEIDSLGEIEVLSSTNKANFHNGTTASPVVTEAHTATLTNKSIDADTNTITNIENADIKSGAAIDATKIANGSVSSTEFQFLDGVTSSIQTQLNGTVSNTLADGKIYIGNGSNVATAVTPSGDVTISNTGDVQLVAGTIVNADINASAAIVDTKLATISTASKVSNSATTATSANTNSAIVARDGSGNFSAGTITAALSGNASTATTAAGLSATLATTSGGTNLTSYTTGDTLYASASNVLSKLAIGTAGQVLTVAGGVPSWAAAGAGGSGYGSGGVASLKSADYTVVSGDAGKLIPVDTSTLVVISLPQISGVSSGFNVIIKDTTGSAATNNITVMPYSGDLIDGGDGGDFISGAYQGFAFVSNGTEWKKLAFTSASASGIRGVFATGRTGSFAQTTSIEYINSSTLGNGTSFGTIGSTRDRCSSSTINNSTRGVFGGGATAGGTSLQTIEYLTVPTLGATTSFGNLSAIWNVPSSCSNSTRGIFAGGQLTTAIEYITIATTGNSTSFGTLNATRDSGPGALASSTRGVISGGVNGTSVDTIEYVTIATTGNGTSFGNMTIARTNHGGISNLTRGIFMGGFDAGFTNLNTTEYVTIATTGNGTSFGTFYASGGGVIGFASSTRGVMAGVIGTANAVVNNIGYITIATTGNSTSFGTLTTARGGGAVACNFAK
jgi:hypothetical protein